VFVVFPIGFHDKYCVKILIALTKEKLIKLIVSLIHPPPKVSTLEDRENLHQLAMDELYGILTAYDLILGHESLPKGEATFKVLKKTKNQKQKPQHNHHEESCVEEANFIKKLQKGSGRYKGKSSFKCFNCGKVGHFEAKCPNPKEDPEDEEDTNIQYKKKGKPNYKKMFYKGKKNF
jgi:hypothetical protein